MTDTPRNEWMPIETAPVNGHDGIPAYVLITHWPCTGRYGVGKAFQRKDGTWWYSGKRKVAYVPTHWMPLPEPPK